MYAIRSYYVAVGTAFAGDGSPGRFTRQDEIQVDVDVVVGLDFTIPAGGVTFTRNQTADGVNFNDRDANDISSRLSASLVASVENRITSYNVCYTKLLRGHVDGREWQPRAGADVRVGDFERGGGGS